MKLHTVALSVISLCSIQALAGEQFVIEPISKKMEKLIAGASKSERVSLKGALRTIPMGGAMLTLQSTNYGQVILFSPLDVDASLHERLKAIEASGATVKVTATMSTICSEKELKAEVMGCRRLDTSKAITVEKL